MARFSKRRNKLYDTAVLLRFADEDEIEGFPEVEAPEVLTTPPSGCRVNYFLATWSGQRLKTEFDDSHLKKHIDQLNKVKHNLAQITIGYPENPNVTQEYDTYIRSLRKLEDGTPIIVHPMENKGYSYGQYSRMYETYRDSFDYYVFVEDDYVPFTDGFDSILINLYNDRPCGFLCGLVFDKTRRYGRSTPRHAAVSNGIASSAALEIVRKKFGCLMPQDVTGAKAQIVFSQNFLVSGLKILDYVDQHLVQYYAHDRLCIFQKTPRHTGPDLFVPSQCFDNRLWMIERRFENGRAIFRDNVSFTLR